jgi:hypothetical protein
VTRRLPVRIRLLEIREAVQQIARMRDHRQTHPDGPIAAVVMQRSRRPAYARRIAREEPHIHWYLVSI